MSDEPPVLVASDGALGQVILHRPRALNCLDQRMVDAMTSALTEWSGNDAIQTIALTGAGEGGLCAGGDLVTLYSEIQAHAAHRTSAQQRAQGPAGRFWRTEYHLNALIGRYPKPYVAVMDGITMGGGVGVAGHGSHRIVTERSVVAMPEVGIGFVPDVGGSFLLSGAPGEIGTHLALTSCRMGPGEAIAAGFADYYVSSADIPAVLVALRTQSADVVLETFAKPPPSDSLSDDREWINTCYSAGSLPEILARLDAHRNPRAQAAAAEIRTKSPIALHATLRLLRQVRELPTLESALNLEYRMAVAALSSHDLAEGIRAQLIDKDRRPHWSPSRIDEVTPEQVDAYCAALGPWELGLEPRGGNTP